ncbi:MAG TPA: QueT transporter family protein, partial [Clostridia bacterium]|nr:QueT transporter family protein [Clostridia bacterium]
MNPQPLGLVDILAGSLVTLLAAFLTWRLAAPWRRRLARQVEAGVIAPPMGLARLLPALMAPIVLNALIVGSYLPFLLQSGRPSLAVIAASVGSIFISQSLVIMGLGLPLVLALRRTPWAKREYLSQGGTES